MRSNKTLLLDCRVEETIFKSVFTWEDEKEQFWLNLQPCRILDLAGKIVGAIEVAYTRLRIPLIPDYSIGSGIEDLIAEMKKRFGMDLKKRPRRSKYMKKWVVAKRDAEIAQDDDPRQAALLAVKGR